MLLQTAIQQGSAKNASLITCQLLQKQLSMCKSGGKCIARILKQNVRRLQVPVCSERTNCINSKCVLDSASKRQASSVGFPYQGSLLLKNVGDNWSWRHSWRRCMSSEFQNRNTDQKNFNPVDDLQKYVAIPILKEEQRVFSPTADEVHRGEQIFWNDPANEIKFLKSAVLSEHLPKYGADMGEVAFIGRSNVGKSSLIQVLLGGQENVHVRTSKTPGHTKLMNFFQVGDMLSVVDMPGYGYRMPSNYVEMVEQFLQSRTKLSRTLFLLDGSIGVTETDVIGLNMMEEFQIPYTIVLTKIDKAKPSSRIRHFMSALKYVDQTRYCLPQPFLVSSITGEGIPFLQAFIAYVTGNLIVKGQ